MKVSFLASWESPEHHPTNAPAVLPGPTCHVPLRPLKQRMTSWERQRPRMLCSLLDSHGPHTWAIRPAGHSKRQPLYFRFDSVNSLAGGSPASTKEFMNGCLRNGTCPLVYCSCAPLSPLHPQRLPFLHKPTSHQPPPASLRCFTSHYLTTYNMPGPVISTEGEHGHSDV